MESLSKSMKLLMTKYLYVVETPCPICNNEMKAWREKEEGPPRCAPVCVECGYKSLKKKEAISTKKIFEDSLKAKAINYLKNSSLVTDKALWNSRLYNYTETDQETYSAKAMASEAVKKILKDEDVHIIYSGRVGSGKSHLSMGILWKVMEESNYEKSCLFVNYRELLEQLKFAMNDDQARKVITGTLMKELKLASCVVLDDLGTELGSIEEARKATPYNLETITSILEARQNKPLIVTTNLTSKQIESVYGDRILSRMLKNSTGFSMRFMSTSDKRVTPLINGDN